ncbi:hypothetical protein ABFS83_05G126800 [Erythranthe nasuta]
MANIDALFGCWVSHHANFMGSQNRRSPENRSRFLKTIFPVAVAHTIIWRLLFERSTRSLRWPGVATGKGFIGGGFSPFFYFTFYLVWDRTEPAFSVLVSIDRSCRVEK